MNFQTQWDREKQPIEKGGGDVLIERTGWAPLGVQIKRMQAAGKRLQEARLEQFDSYWTRQDDLIDVKSEKRYNDKLEMLEKADMLKDKKELVEKTALINKKKQDALKKEAKERSEKADNIKKSEKD